MDWSDGYVVDTEYRVGFFRKLAPSYLSVVCIMNGYEPVPIDRPFTYFELGCGHGFTASMLAASNPQGQFYAADFMPSHIAAGRQLADSAGLDNLTLLENSFAELAAGKVHVPALDFISLHGVYSWVSPENRRHIVDFIGRYLKPGGIVYVSYNALPGWSSVAPLQRLVREHADAHPGSRDLQVRGARDLIDKMIAAKAGYFEHATKSLTTRLESWQKYDAHYLSHEYMNRCWQPMYHADVAREFSAAKADFAGSVELGASFDHMCLTPEQRELLGAAPDPAWRETLKDYMTNTIFRGDVFVRGARRMAPARRRYWMEQLGVALTVARESATLGFPPADTPGAEGDVAAPLLDQLAKCPRSLADLASLPGHNMDTAAQVMALMVLHDQGLPYFLSSASMPVAAAHRMNAAIARQSLLDDRHQAFASPLLGSGVGIGLIGRLVYGALLQQPERLDAMAITRQVWQAMKDQGAPILDADKAADGTMEDELAEILPTVKKVLDVRLAAWRQLKFL
jgi:SAM-dependent methyltransferase